MKKKKLFRNLDVCERCENYKFKEGGVYDNTYHTATYQCALEDKWKRHRNPMEYVTIELPKKCKYWFEHQVLAEEELSDEEFEDM